MVKKVRFVTVVKNQSKVCYISEHVNIKVCQSSG